MDYKLPTLKNSSKKKLKNEIIDPKNQKMLR